MCMHKAGDSQQMLDWRINITNQPTLDHIIIPSGGSAAYVILSKEERKRSWLWF